jgi:hypothetical protein
MRDYNTGLRTAGFLAQPEEAEDKTDDDDQADDIDDAVHEEPLG